MKSSPLVLALSVVLGPLSRNGLIVVLAEEPTSVRPLLKTPVLFLRATSPLKLVVYIETS